MERRGGEGALVGVLERVLPAVSKGNSDSLNELCLALRPFMERCVRRHVADRAWRWQEVDDIVQQVQVETVRELPRLPAENTPEELLRRIRRTARSRVIDALRNNGKLRGESVSPVTPERLRNPTRPTGDVTGADRRDWLHEFVARLPARYAEVVRLCAFEELSCVEAGRRLGLEPDTVRKRYEAARGELARRLAGRDEL